MSLLATVICELRVEITYPLRCRQMSEVGSKKPCPPMCVKEADGKQIPKLCSKAEQTEKSEAKQSRIGQKPTDGEKRARPKREKKQKTDQKPPWKATVKTSKSVEKIMSQYTDFLNKQCDVSRKLYSAYGAIVDVRTYNDDDPKPKAIMVAKWDESTNRYLPNQEISTVEIRPNRDGSHEPEWSESFRDLTWRPQCGEIKAVPGCLEWRNVLDDHKTVKFTPLLWFKNTNADACQAEKEKLLSSKKKQKKKEHVFGWHMSGQVVIKHVVFAIQCPSCENMNPMPGDTEKWGNEPVFVIAEKEWESSATASKTLLDIFASYEKLLEDRDEKFYADCRGEKKVVKDKHGQKSCVLVKKNHFVAPENCKEKEGQVTSWREQHGKEPLNLAQIRHLEETCEKNILKCENKLKDEPNAAVNEPAPEPGGEKKKCAANPKPWWKKDAIYLPAEKEEEKPPAENEEETPVKEPFIEICATKELVFAPARRFTYSVEDFQLFSPSKEEGEDGDWVKYRKLRDPDRIHKLGSKVSEESTKSKELQDYPEVKALEKIDCPEGKTGCVGTLHILVDGIARTAVENTAVTTSKKLAKAIETLRA